MPNVSVIIATHNHAKYLPECLNSVKNQIYKDYEIIVINNGSTDETEKVIKDLEWDQLRYHYQRNTGSVAGPRNTGISMAKGKYVAFLDSDDLWYDNKLNVVMRFFNENPDVDIISHDLMENNNGRRGSVLKSGPLASDMFKALLIENRLLGSATVVKVKVINDVGKFDTGKQYVHCEDYETWLRIAYKSYKFDFLNIVLGEYRIHGENLSNDQELVFKNWMNVLNKHLPNYKGKNILDRNIVCFKTKGNAHFTIAKRKLLLFRNKMCKNG